MAQDTSRMGRSGSRALSAAVSAVLATAGGAAAAQDEPLQPTSLGEVIVTATKRAERLQDVSESIAAFDANAIEMRGLKQIDDIVKYIPGMSLSQREPGGTTIVFRGVASSGIQFGAVSSSALYLDEQPITQSGRSPDPRFIDIERVEALRGPQGTLYGASSQSGTLRVITTKPDPSGFDAWTEAEVTSVSDGDVGYDISAMLNLPLAERLSLRIVGFAAEDAGFIDNVLTQSKGQTFDNADVVEEDVNTVNTMGGRAALRLDISDSMDLTLTGIYQDISADGHGDVTPASVDGFGYPDVGDLEQVRFSKESLDDSWYQFGLTLNAATPIGDLVIAASYFDRDFHYEADATDYEWNFNCPRFDSDGNENLPAPFCQPNYAVYDFGGDPRGFAQNDEQTEITTFEARLQSSADEESRWSWLVGAFYSKETSQTQFDSFVNNYADTPAFAYFSYLQYAYYGSTLAPTDQWWLGVYDTDLEQRAIFGEVSFDVTENFTITAGGRWFEYDRKFELHQESPVGFTGFSVTDAIADTDDSGSVMKLNMSYRIDDDRMVYATYSEGFRNGGSNPVRPSSILPREFTSDELKNYEVGAKTEWLNNRLRFNIALYSMQWDDFAVQVEDPQPGVFQLGYVNLPSAEIKGFESELQFAIDDAWQVDASLGYNEGEVSEATELVLDPAFDPIPVTKGARLPLTPDWTATLGIEFRPRTTMLNAQPFARVDLAYVGESVNNLVGIESVVAAGGVQVQESYDTGDFRIGLEGEGWSAALFVDNFWDERANLFRSNRWAEPRQSINRPRTYGLQFRYDW
ncbi:MAG: TonB-dependent receptor [Pseudomonadota bacterium]|nr:TonB-dependent receptor [Pseudomonadota bacterium]